MEQSKLIDDISKIIYEQLNASAGAGTRKKMIIKMAILEYMLNGGLELKRKQ